MVPVTQGKFTSADGRVFEGDLVYDQIMAYCLNSSKGLHPLSGKTKILGRRLGATSHTYFCAFSVCVYTRHDSEHPTFAGHDPC